MSKEFLFWFIFFFCLLFGGWSVYHIGGGTYWGYGPFSVEMILIGLLGWKVFGAAVK